MNIINPSNPGCTSASATRFTYDRSRDTAWYSVIDSEWPRLRAVFERWLERDNFDASGLQRASLGDIRAALQSNRTADGRPGED